MSEGSVSRVTGQCLNKDLHCGGKGGGGETPCITNIMDQTKPANHVIFNVSSTTAKVRLVLVVVSKPWITTDTPMM